VKLKLSLFLLLPLFMFAASAEEGSFPVRFDPSVVELGSIPTDSRIEYEVGISNPGEGVLTVQLLPTCGCLAEGGGSYDLAAGEARTLKMVFDSTGMQGEFEKFFLVRVSGRASAKAYFAVTGRISI